MLPQLSERGFVNVEYRHTHDRPLTVELTRGAKGVYRWSIRYHGSDTAEVIDELLRVDRRLFDLFVHVPPEEDYGNPGHTD